jgi:hypothetical protein
VTGPVQDPVPGFHRVTRSPGSISIFKKSQNDIILVKKNKSQRVATGFYRVKPLGYTRSLLFLFFFNPTRFQPWIGRVSGRPAGPGLISKLYISGNKILNILNDGNSYNYPNCFQIIWIILIILSF